MFFKHLLNKKNHFMIFYISCGKGKEYKIFGIKNAYNAFFYIKTRFFVVFNGFHINNSKQYRKDCPRFS